MKQKDLWFATAAAVVLTGMTMMTSCSKDDYELPEVIESEVYDEGEAGEVRDGSRNGRHSTELRELDYGPGYYPRQLRQQSLGYSQQRAEKRKRRLSLQG